MPHSRRSVLAALGGSISLGLADRAPASPVGEEFTLRLLPFEAALRKAFAAPDQASPSETGPSRCRRVEVGYSELVRAGIQGCHNDRAFAGFPAGHLKIVRVQTGPGPECRGVRLHVCSVDVVATGGTTSGDPGRPLDFSSLPPAPLLHD